MLVPRLAVICTIVAKRIPAAWLKGKARVKWITTFVIHLERMHLQALFPLTPCTWVGSDASLVARAPTLFLGSSNQLRSFNRTQSVYTILTAQHISFNKIDYFHLTVLILISTSTVQKHLSWELTTLTCLIIDVKALSLNFKVRISPHLPKQTPC